MDNRHLGTKGVKDDKSYKTRHLKLITELISAILGTGGTPAPTGIATEATLLQVLAKEDTEFQMQYLKDANDILIWIEVDSVDGVKTYSYYDGPGGSVIIPTQPLKPLSLGVDTELIEDEYIAIVTNLTNGYAVGDILAKISYFELNTSTPTLLNSFWYNKTTSTILSTVDILDLEDQDGPLITTPGTTGITISTDGTYTFTFDADAILIENPTIFDLTITFGGILGSSFIVRAKTVKEFEYDVAKVDDITVSGLTTGSIEVIYSRGK